MVLLGYSSRTTKEGVGGRIGPTTIVLLCYCSRTTKAGVGGKLDLPQWFGWDIVPGPQRKVWGANWTYHNGSAGIWFQGHKGRCGGQIGPTTMVLLGYSSRTTKAGVGGKLDLPQWFCWDMVPGPQRKVWGANWTSSIRSSSCPIFKSTDTDIVPTLVPVHIKIQCALILSIYRNTLKILHNYQDNNFISNILIFSMFAKRIQ
jgi:hypothetical protein